MNAQTIFFYKPEELTTAIDEAIAPFTRKLTDVFRRVEPLPSVLSIAWIAEDCSCSRATVRQWITKGRKRPGWTTIVRLRVVGGLTDSRHLVRVEDYENFLEQLPAIRAQSMSMSFAAVRSILLITLIVCY